MVLYFIRKVTSSCSSPKKSMRYSSIFSHTKGTILLFIKILARPNILTQSLWFLIFFLNYLNQLHATKRFCYRRSTLAVIREDSSMSSWHSYNYWRRSLLKIPFSTLVEVFDVHAITLLLVDGGWNLSTEEVIWLFGYDFPENYMFHDGWLLPFKIHLLVIPIMSW